MKRKPFWRGQPAADANLKLDNPIDRLLRCNDPPTDEERALISRRVEAVQTELNLAIIKQGTTGAAVLSSSCKGHNELLHAYRNLLRGVRDLPDEVLEFVFDCVLEATPNRHSALASLLATSQRWKVVAQSYSRLWRKLPDIAASEIFARSLQLSDFSIKAVDTVQDAERLKFVVEKYIHRSGTMPLTFKFKLLCEYPDDDLGGHLSQTFVLLVQHCERWEDVSIVISNKVLRGLGASIAGRLPLLTTLALSLKHEDTGPSWGHTMDPLEMFSVCPSLRKVISLTQSFDPFIPNIPWTQLSTFHRYNINSYNGLSSSETVLEEGTNVLKCFIQGSALDYVKQNLYWYPSARMTVLNLACGVLGQSGDDIATWFSDQLYLPSLITLSLALRTATLPHIHSFLVRSNCSLRGLFIRIPSSPESTGPPGSSTMLSHILGLCPELERLAYGVPSSADLRSLTFDSSDPTSLIVPKLRSLTFRIPKEGADLFGHIWTWSLDTPALTAMAKSRADTARAHRHHLVQPTITLSFHDSTSRRDNFHALENGAENPSLPSSDTPSQKWHAELYKTCCSPAPNKHAPRLGGVHLERSYYTEGRRMHELLKELEGYPIDDLDLMSLQVSWLAPMVD